MDKISSIIISLAELPEYMSGLFAIGTVTSYNINGDFIKEYPELISPTQFHTLEELKEYVISSLNLSKKDDVEIIFE